MKRPVLFLIGLIAIFGPTAPLSAGFVVYTDRTSWRAAAGNVYASEDFNSFAADAVIGASSPVALAGGMSLSTLYLTDGAYNRVDTPPLDSSYAIDSTNYARLSTGVYGGTAEIFNPLIRFSNPTSAFGADFIGLQDGVVRTEIHVFNGGTLLAALSPTVYGHIPRFLGVASDANESITEIRFVSVGPGDYFGMDNIEIGTNVVTPVPEPGTFALLGIGVTVVVGYGCGRRFFKRQPST